MKDLKRNLKNERGATGIDVIVSAAMLLITIAVVSMLYVNTSIQSKNMTRTAGATRIATNVAEYIQTLSYIDFLNVYESQMDGSATYNTKDYQVFHGSTSNRTIFGSKVPTGYTLYINAENVYGSHIDPKEQFDLVRNVEILVTYEVGKVMQEVSFTITKQRELIGECNEPSLAYLKASTTLGPNTQYFPIKYNERIGAYVKTSFDDIDWYNYKNKKWALVIASSRPESELFDANGKFKYIETDTQMYVWIPRFFVNSTSSLFECFTYNGTDLAIKESVLESNPAPDHSTSTFKYYTFDTKPDEAISERAGTDTGHWLLLRKDVDSIADDMYAQKLDASVYGPFDY